MEMIKSTAHPFLFNLKSNPRNIPHIKVNAAIIDAPSISIYACNPYNSKTMPPNPMPIPAVYRSLPAIKPPANITAAPRQNNAVNGSKDTVMKIPNPMKTDKIYAFGNRQQRCFPSASLGRVCFAGSYHIPPARPDTLKAGGDA